MINCQNAKEIINGELDGEIKDSEQTQLEEHLSTCDSCNIYQKNLLKLHNALTALPEPKVEFNFVDQLIEANHFKMNNRTKYKFDWKKISPLYGIAVAAILFVLFIPISGFFDKPDFEGAQILQKNTESPDEVANENVEESQFGLLTDRKLEGNKNYGSDAINVEDKVELDNVKGSVNDKNNNENYLVIQATDGSNLVPKVIDNQLVIYSNEVEIYRTDKWEENLTIEWDIEEDYIIYSLFNQDGILEDKYQINPFEKKEEKIME